MNLFDNIRALMKEYWSEATNKKSFQDAYVVNYMNIDWASTVEESLLEVDFMLPQETLKATAVKLADDLAAVNLGHFSIRRTTLWPNATLAFEWQYDEETAKIMLIVDKENSGVLFVTGEGVRVLPDDLANNIKYYDLTTYKPKNED